MNFIFNDDFKIIDRFGSSCMSSLLWEINAHACNHMSTIVLVDFSYYSHDSNTDERRLS